MANRYWVGGSNYWNATAGTKWSTTSGGAGGAAVPTSSDDVYFDANSGSVTVNIADATCKNLVCTGFTGTLYSPVVYVYAYGSVTIPYTVTLTTFRLSMVGNTTQTLTIGSGLSLEALYTEVGSSVVLGNHLFCPYFRIYGTFDANDYNVDIGYLGSGMAVGTEATLIMGAGSTWTIWSDVWRIGSGTTITCETSTIIMYSYGPNLQQYASEFYGKGKTYYEVINATTNGYGLIIADSNTFNHLHIGAGSPTYFTDGTTQTISSSFAANGFDHAPIVLTGTGTAGWTISDTTGTNTADWCNISYSTATGGATWNATNSIDSGNNSGWNITPPPTTWLGSFIPFL